MLTHCLTFVTGSILATGLAGLVAAAHFNEHARYQFSTVTGYFLQDANGTDASTFDYTAVNFGLINRTYDTDGYGGSGLTQWQRFSHQVAELNREASHDTSYRVLFMGRHGEGYHNAAESYYGTPAWNCYWAELDGNGTSVWSDAHLTSKGIAQAQIANAFWRHEMAVQKIPAPQTYYTSPLYRCLSTANITFGGLDLPRHQPFIPTIKHGLRESVSIHTTDRRSNKTVIANAFPHYKFETGFPEHDLLWNGVTSETNSHQDIRSMKVLTDILSKDRSTYISITSHSGEIASILRVLGHRPFSLATGAVIPVLIRVRRVHEPSTTTSNGGFTPSAHCTSPPITSIANGPCVCQSSAAPVTSRLPGSGPKY